GNDVEAGGLAGTIGAEEPDHLAAPHRDGNATQHRSLAELLHQIVGHQAGRQRGDFRRRLTRLLPRHAQAWLVPRQCGCGHGYCDGCEEGMIRLLTVPDPLGLPSRRVTPVLTLTSAYSPLNWLPAFVTFTLPDRVMMSFVRS